MTIHPRSPQRARTWRRATLAAVLLAGTALGGYAAGHHALAADPPVNPSGTVAAPAQLPDFTHLVQQVKPAVVSITTKMKSDGDEEEGEGPMQGPPMQLPPPFNHMFPQFGGPGPQHVVEARGSGFIIKPDGIIITNNHVVKDAESVTVTLNDGKTVPAKIVGTDPRTDIAVLKIDAGHRLPYIELGESNDVKPGEWVVAMGNPFGLGGTVTAGIVSAVSRDIGDGPYDQFIQTDAPINEGNSGGPLFTQQGKVIGMNTAILSPSGGSIGIGFAIPSDMISTVTTQLEAHGHVTRGYIGVEAQELKGATAEALHLKDDAGALLAGVLSNGPAQSAGLQPGDVIQSVNGQAIRNPRELAVDVAGLKPGSEAHLSVLRDGQAKDFSLKVGTLPSERTASNEMNGGEAHGEQLGLALAPLSPQMRDQLNIPGDTTGVVVRQVKPGSPADKAGLQAGDVIVGVGTQKVTSVQEAARAIHAAISSKDHAVALRVMRDGQAVFVGVTLGQNEG
jgi:serine protease Do